MKDPDNHAEREEFIEPFRPSGLSADDRFEEIQGRDVYDWFCIQLDELEDAVSRAIVRCSEANSLEGTSLFLEIEIRVRLHLLREAMVRLHPIRPFSTGRHGITKVMGEWVRKVHHAFIWKIQLEAGEASTLQVLRSGEASPEDKAKAASLIMDYADYTANLRIALEDDIFCGWVAGRGSESA